MNGSGLDRFSDRDPSEDNDVATRNFEPGNHFWSYESWKPKKEGSTIPVAFTANHIPYDEMQRRNYWANYDPNNPHMFGFPPTAPHHSTGQAATNSHWDPNHPMSWSIHQPAQNHEGGFMEDHLPYGSVPTNTPNHTMSPPFQGSPRWPVQNGNPTETHVNDSKEVRHPESSSNHDSIVRQSAQNLPAVMEPERTTPPQNNSTLVPKNEETELPPNGETKEINANFPKKQLQTPNTANAKAEQEQKVLAMDIFVTDPPRFNNWCPPRLGKVLKAYLAGFVVLPYDLEMPRRQAVIALNGRIKARIGKFVEPEILSRLMVSMRKRFRNFKVSTDNSG
ncbi:hypothetical protein CAEBREN_05421 [Caenorhabditis brenneri]|uniref:Uncharacterized protein n=1 Tax=Caenorhabditis brenneri TaxID=135651 RepID=G0MX23_CAEBE|nr:hypothetical protein CAEBREN_05421 [Caenorhabditis brenneri]